MGAFNPSRLRVARKRRRFNKTALAELVGLDLRSISAYENGEYEPASETMGRIADKLAFPLDFFLGEDLHEPSPTTASFRSLARMTAKNREAALASGALAILFNDWIEQRFTLPFSDLPDLREEDAETAAMVLRNQWGLGEKPIRNMVHLLESKGIRVFSMAEDTTAIDAFCLWRDTTPFVFLNTMKSAERGRYDAAHELGHLVLHRDCDAQGKEAEHEANRFAAAFLMPRGSVLAHAPILPNMSVLISLKKHWIVSVAALAYRLHSLHLLTDWHYRSLCIEIAQRGYRTREPVGGIPEMSMILRKVFHVLQEEGISKADLASELKYNVEDLDNVVFGLVLTSVSGGNKHATRQKSTRPLMQLIKSRSQPF